VYDRPASPFVVRFFGEANQLSARRFGDRLMLVGVHPDSGGAGGRNGANGCGHGDTLLGLLRPNDVTLSTTPTEGALPVSLGRVRRTGPRIRLELHHTDAANGATNGAANHSSQVATLDAELTHERFVELGLQAGERAFILPRNIHVFHLSSTSSAVVAPEAPNQRSQATGTGERV
jgi:sulfate/thiosulfate transport system ATP-binding protein